MMKIQQLKSPVWERTCLTLLSMLLLAQVALANQDVPAVLPQPDKNPPAQGRVKVYILAGQSNMVGFGYLDGAQPVYPSIYLSPDSNIKVGRMPVGPSALLRHGIFQSDQPGSATGAKVSIFEGAYKPGTDFDVIQPIKQTTVDLGQVATNLPTVEGPHTIVADAFIEVPVSGMFEIHAGFESSSNAVVTVGETEVYRKEPNQSAIVSAVQLKHGQRYSVRIIYLQGGSAAFWMKQIDLKGQGDLRTLLAQGKYPWFADEQGNWTVRNDVTYWETRISKTEGGSGGPLSTNSNGKFIGPEVPFGYVMGTYHEEPVLLIESSMGNRALSFDFRPPSSGKSEEEKANKYCGLEYDLMVEGVQKTLKNIDQVVPDYQGQGYEIAGFVWFQGHKDKDVPKAEYERHLVNLIADLKKQFNAPAMKTVVATVGFSGMDMEPGHAMTWEAQMAVGDSKQHPELVGKVATVDTRPFWRNRGQSPTNTGYHYNHNAETYVLTGDALGRAMVGLLGGKAEPLEVPTNPQQHSDVELIYSDEVTGRFNKTGPHYDAQYYRAMDSALKPILVEEMVPEFMAKAFAPNSRGMMKSIASGKRPTKLPLDIQCDLDTLMQYYDIAGIDDYAWQPFDCGMRNAMWSYHSFDPPEQQALEKSDRFREVTFPEGMDQWFSNEFDPTAAGWKMGKAPFGRMGDKLDRLRPRCNGTHCGCSELPTTLWEKEVLLMRQSFEVPPLKDGHAYRLILGGAGCDRSGEGFAVYVNGKLLTQSDGGFFRNSGVRGGYIFDDLRSEFETGKVTISIISFLRYTHFRDKTTYFGPYKEYYSQPVPPNGHVNVWMEQAKLPPEVLKLAREEK